MDFTNNSQINNSSTFVLAQAVVLNAIRRGHDFAVTAPAPQQLLAANRLDDFKESFGDCFVRGIFTGGEFLAVFRLTSTRADFQSSLSATLAGEANGLLASGSFKAAFDQAQSDSSSHTEISVDFYQRAGIGDETSITLDVDSILDRLKNFPAVAHAHPVGLQAEVATYDTVPLPLPTPIEVEFLMEALQDADNKRQQWLVQRNDLEFAREHPEFFTDPPPDTVLGDAVEAFTRALNAVMDFSVRLARGQISPPVLFDPAAAGITFPPSIPSLVKREDPFTDKTTRDFLGNWHSVTGQSSDWSKMTVFPQDDVTATVQVTSTAEPTGIGQTGTVTSSPVTATVVGAALTFNFVFSSTLGVASSFTFSLLKIDPTTLQATIKKGLPGLPQTDETQMSIWTHTT
jgi:hypothetical protein